MSEWVLESDWSKVNVGDRVRLTCDAGSVEGEVSFVGVLPHPTEWRIILLDVGVEWRESLWTLYVAPKPTPALPTEPGIYADNGGDHWLLDKDGTWIILSLFGEFEVYADHHVIPSLCAPFTRLESQAETAEAVLAAVMRKGEHVRNTYKVHAADIAEIAAEFGVTL